VSEKPASAAGASVATAVATAEAYARAVTRLGRYFAVALVLGSAVQGAMEETLGQQGWRAGLGWTALFAAAAVVLLFLGPALADAATLAGGLRAEVARGNMAAAVVSAGNRVAVGVVLSHCFYGADLATFLVSLAFVGIGFATLLGLQWLYRRLTRYADDQEIRAENTAAALSYAGVTVALSIIVGHATWGSFDGWASSLRGYAAGVALALGLYPVRQVLVKRVLLGLPFALRGGALDRALAQERNVVVGAVEGTAYVATALLVTGIL
jgi:uncharacterized membrane protein YjfL (UPF0719 family)